MEEEHKRVLFVLASVLAVFIYHVGEIPATGELSAAALLAAALGGGVFIGVTVGNSQTEELKDIRKHLAKVRLRQEADAADDVIIEVDE
jgi:hypothetical protein